MNNAMHQSLCAQIISQFSKKNIILKSVRFISKLLLKNALLQLGAHGTDLVFSDSASLNKNDFPFFIANMSAVLNNPFKRIIAFLKVGRFEYFSKAYHLSLLIENRLLNPATAE
jgi:hypothetical protein